MNKNTNYLENYFYPRKISSILAGMVADEERSIIEDYLWSTYGGESIDF